MAIINTFQISYPDFKLNEMIDPEQFDINNADITAKFNQIIPELNNTYRKEETTPVNGDHKGTWNGFTPLQVAEGINSQRIDKIEQSPYLFAKGGIWGGIGSGNTLFPMPLYSSSVFERKMVSGFTINSNNDVVCNVAGVYSLRSHAVISGLNNTATFDTMIRVMANGNESDWTNDYASVTGYTGLGGNLGEPQGVHCIVETVYRLNVGDKIRFYVRCSEAPRNINSMFIRISRISY